MRAELQNIVDKITKSLKLLEQRMDLGSVDHRLEGSKKSANINA